MKKSLLFLSMVATVAMTLITGCQKEISAPIVSTHKVTIVASQELSKTTVAEEEGKAVFSWTEEDMNNFHVFENGYAATYLVGGLDEDGKATILAEFEDHPAAEYVYTGFLSSETAEDGKYPSIPATQTVGDKLYASSCDVLVAEPQQYTTVAEEFVFAFKRPVSVAKMTITNLVAGEIVESVKVSADKDIIGYYNISTDEWVANGKVVDVVVNKTVAEGGSIDVGFVALPFEGATLTVKVTTSKEKYSKTFGKTLSLVEGSLVAFKVNMSGCEITPIFHETFDKCEGTGGNDGTWSGISVSSALADGDFDNSGWTFNKGYSASNCARFGIASEAGWVQTPALNIPQDQNVTISFKAGAWSGDKAEITLEVAGNGFLSSNRLEINNGAWTDLSVVLIGGDADTKLKISAVQSSKNRFFIDNLWVEKGGEDFTYLKVSPSDTTVAATCTSVDIDIISNGSWTAVSKNGNTLSPASGTGNATVSLSFPENTSSQEYKDTVTFTASDKVVKFALAQQPGKTATITIAEFIELADTENDHHLRGCVSDISGKNFTLTDKTGSIYVYSFVDDIVFAAGDSLTMYGKYKNYKGTDEVVSGRYVSHDVTPTLSVDKNNIEVESDVTSASFNITSNTSWTVASSNPAISVSAASGENNATITLNFPENESTSSAVTSTITVSSSTPGVVSSPCEIAFTQAKKEAGTLKEVDLPSSTTFTYSGSGVNGILTYEQGDFTIVQAKGSSSTSVSSGNNTVGTLRVYGGNTLTFTSAFSIKEIEIGHSGSYNGGTITASKGEIKSGVWTGSAKEIVLSPSSQWRITSIKVTYLSNAAPIEVTDKTINTNGSVQLSEMFSSPSSGAFTYELTENPGSAGKIEAGVFSTTAAGTYKVKATQAAAGDYTHVGSAIGTITVTEPTWTLQSIAITTPPTKTSYEAGEKFDPKGMVVTGYFKDENNVDKNWEVSGYTYPTEDLTEGTTSVQVSYTYGEVTKTADQTISVVAPTTVWVLKGIAVTSAPTKTSYKIGEALDLSGMVVTATYSDNAGVKEDKQETVTSWTSDPANGSTLSTAGDVTVTISYTSGEVTKEATTKVTVSAAAKIWTYTVSTNSPKLNASNPATVNGATWSIVMGTKVGSPTTDGAPTNSYSKCGWKWGNSSSKYWKSYTLSTDYFTEKKVSKVTVKFLNNGSKSATMTIMQGTTTIGTDTKTFGTTWTDLSANAKQGTSGTLTIQYSVEQASLINSITVEYYD